MPDAPDDGRDGADDLQSELTELRAALASEQERHAALRNRRAVKVAVRAANRLGPVARTGKAGIRRADRARRRVLAARQKRQIGRARRSGAMSGPGVSIVIPSHNGAALLDALLDKLATTKYEPFEVIVVDNGSDDDTARVVAKDRPYPARTLRNDVNETFSIACNQGAAAATHPLVLFLNNDVRPLHRTWLGAMVDRLDEDTAAVGALLAYPDVEAGGSRLRVQHAGIRFSWRDGAPRPVNTQPPDASAPDLLDDGRFPAVTGAALLTSREHFDAVGGFTVGFRYGWEDVDLCMKLAERGAVVRCGGAALEHIEFGTQDTLSREQRAANFRHNSRLFWDRWLPGLSRRLRNELFAGHGPFWCERGHRRIAVIDPGTPPTVERDDPVAAGHLADAFEAIGWSRAPDTDEAAVVVSLDPTYDVSGRSDGAVRLAWARTNIEEWLASPHLEAYDIVLAGSAAIATALRPLTTVPIEVALPATAITPATARPSVDTAFVGSPWEGGRRFLELVDPQPSDSVAIHGDWETHPPGHRWWLGPLPDGDAASAYQSARVVVDVSQDEKLDRPSRAMDAVASGALVVTDDETAAQELFDGLLPNGQEIGELIRHHLSDEPSRVQLVERLQQTLIDRHTYRHRAESMISAAHAFAAGPLVTIRTSAPAPDVAERWGDTHFARGFAAGLATLGVAAHQVYRNSWELPRNQQGDVTIHLRGLDPSHPLDGQFNILWIISHPDEVEAAEIDRFDLAFAASELFVSEMQPKTATPLYPLLQASRNTPVSSGTPSDEICFVGNARGGMRPVVQMAMDAGLEPSIYGFGWDGLVPHEWIRSDNLPNHETAAVYASARAVLNDHHPDMARRGFVSNRIFDVLAAGGRVVSDPVVGLDDLFAGAVPTFSTPDELVQAIERAGSIRRPDMSGHTFDARAASFVEVVAAEGVDLLA